MPKTNYDLFIEQLNEHELAWFIMQDSFHNRCNYCAEYSNPDCDECCLEHITEYFMQEVDNEKVS